MATGTVADERTERKGARASRRRRRASWGRDGEVHGSGGRFGVASGARRPAHPPVGAVGRRGRARRRRTGRTGTELACAECDGRMRHAGSSCCYAQADSLLEVPDQVNFGAKRIERTTRSVGENVESRRETALSGALSVASGDGGGDVPARKPLKEGAALCVALDSTAVRHGRRRPKAGGTGTTAVRARARRRSAHRPSRALGDDAVSAARG